MKHRLAAGTFAVAFLLAGTRWASYIGAPPLFLTDVLVALGLGSYAVAQTVRTPGAISTRPRVGLFGFALLYSVIRLCFGATYSLEALRDFAPYGYMILGLVGCWSLSITDSQGRRTTNKVLMLALWFHAGWLLVAVLIPSLPFEALGGSSQTPIFTTRPDVDAAINAVFVTVLLVRVSTRQARAPRLAILAAAAGMVPIFLQGSRAGLLALAACLMFGYLATRTSVTRERHLRQSVVALLLLIVAFILVPQTEVGHRLASTIGAADGASSSEAIGTLDARLGTWTSLTDWMVADGSRLVVGVGFGPNFMVESGAILELVGESPDRDQVRSPHNYWLGTLARLGLVGTIPILVLVLTALRASWRQRETFKDDEIRLVASLLVVGIVVVGTVGVVLEAPFGSIPFWWSVGLLLAWDSRTHHASMAEVTPTVSVNRRRPRGGPSVVPSGDVGVGSANRW